jgi:hypothetical protein
LREANPNSTRSFSQLSNHMEMFLWFVHLMHLSSALCDLHCWGCTQCPLARDLTIWSCSLPRDHHMRP